MIASLVYSDFYGQGGERLIHIGTSGYNYPEWRGSFYPEGFSTTKMLAYYAERFGTVEINYSFYRLPSEKALDGWAEGVRLLISSSR
ncbi:MAG: Uncharacterized conserved protein YecE, DUF72 family [Chloroflexi bacterium]|nr:MAG: Uncharacterized conserved protein YecE, DUF72 family [Chloroflexota bacterium]